jgi:hypothetical protein
MTYVESPAAADPHRPNLPPKSPFFETPAGELFFRNMLFVTPALIVMVPVLMKAVVTTLGFLDGPSRVFDTLPIVAGYALPWVGWLFVFAIRPALRNLTMDISPRLRGLLFAFLLIHIGVLTSTVLAWIR